MADDADTVRAHRRELLRKRIAESGLTAEGAGEERQVTAGEHYPLSDGQRRMWFLQTMDPTDTTLNICVAFRLTGALHEPRLHAALSDVVARHDILRTTYGVDAEGEPYQVFRDSVEISSHAQDLTGLGEQDRERRIAELAHDEFGKPFDLKCDVPLRITLLHTATDERVMFLVAHHICWDDDCWSVFFDDLSKAYNGHPPGPRPPQFVAVEVLGKPAEPAAEAIDYWRNTLSPTPEPVQLPGSAAPHPGRLADRRTRLLPTDLLARVESYAKEHGATPFMVLLAAFGVLMRRYTGASDFLVSVPVTDRRASAEGAVGYFGNTLMLRLATRPLDTFASFVDTVRETCLGGFAHQAVGIDRVVREANPDRPLGRDGMAQLVQLGFSVRKSAADFAFDGITASQLELSATTAQLPLALAVVLEPNSSIVEFEYQTDVLADGLIDQMLAHYVRLLDSALDAPDRRLTTLGMLGADERAAVMAQSHGELVATPATTMVAVLEGVADTVPDAIALVSDEAQLTYRELHQRANRLARWLIVQGIGAEDIVGLRMTTSVEFIVAMLAVMKSGAAYLPIDPAYPDERIEYLVTDARPTTVMGRREFDAAEQAAAQMPDVALTDGDRSRALRPGHLAYVIYTSGSTGRPKGVAVSHHAIAEHIEGFVAEWSMTAEDRLLQSSSVSFDASLLDIFVTLSLGARLIVPKPDAFSDVDYVADLISRRGVTVLHMVPSMLSTLLLLPQVNEWRALRHVPVGGEALSGEVADKFAGYFDAELRNHYGPTEAVVCSTHMLVKGRQGASVVPIGVPNRNVYAYVLDEELQPVPAGVVGELYLGGDQLARGYLQRPGLTAQRFVADPFTPGSRLYRSGDLVRRNESGELEFVGRADEQVKIRGYRIELGEVESVISRHPAVRYSLVLAEESQAGPLLAAYIVPVGDQSSDVDLDDIRTHAVALLPEYMVPSAFAVIPEIPLTVSGKLDKRALPAPNRVAVQTYREPATPAERQLCAIFARIFGCQRVGSDDSFFTLGGHSLLAARLVAQIRAEFGVQLPVRAVFDAPTPAGLATRLLDSVPSGAPNRPGLVETVRPERVPLSYSQLAMWFQYRMEGATDMFNLALTLRFDGPLDTRALAEALNDVVARHESLRTTFGEHEGMPFQIVHRRLGVDLAVADVGTEGLDESIAELRRHVFTPESGPLVKATLLTLGPHSHVLHLLLHHLITDHVSLGVVFDDLIVAYRARRNAQEPKWAPLGIQYADYCVWQHAAFDAVSTWGESELAYWRDALAGLPDEISVAPDFARPPVIGKRGEVVKFTVAAARRDALTQLAERSGASEFMVCHAVLAVVLYKLGGGTDIAIGSPVASRVDPTSADLVGLFANMVVLRTGVAADLTLRGMLSRSRDAVLDAFAHQELPIERLVDALNPSRSRSRNPLFQSMINFRGEDWALSPVDLSGTGESTVTSLPMELDVSYLDLNVGLNAIADGGLDVWVVGNSDLYKPASVALIATALDTVLDAFATNPDCALATLEVLPAADLERLLSAPAAAVTETPSLRARASVETQQTLIVLLEELLDITGVEPDDNFFALGGDSTISIQWSSRAAAQGLPLTPPMVFEHMTIAELAGAVDAAADAPAADPVPEPDYVPMSASGLTADALAGLAASWQQQA